uniref:Thioredoxin domain-containing protein n=1 Tax=Entomoneis paludosa TaxID=265537 RepID=A0A7S2V9K9_9STRA|mmetsp:Transcript_13347/g.27671  ORF Transcript_13347/g.27671 Transcript_13347/m.27671 type:complete len:211 (+) Transcript_13347:58-690(+)
MLSSFAVRNHAPRAVTVTARQFLQSQNRSIMVGTNMQSSVISLQQARPWSMSESNLAVDHAVTLKELFAADKRVVLFGVPAPFTGTCTLEHYPGYQKLASTLQTDYNVDEIICYTVADPYAHHGWSLTLNNDPQQIRFLADPDASFARAYGVDATYDDCSLGLRSQRFSMLVEKGTVVNFHVVDGDAAEDAPQMLQNVQELQESLEDSST